MATVKQNQQNQNQQNQNQQNQNQNQQIFFLKDPYSKKKLFFPSGKATKLLKKYVKHLTRFKYDKHYDKQLKLKRKNPIKKINQQKVREILRNGWNQTLMFVP